MKRLLLGMLVLMIAVPFAGCGSQVQPSPQAAVPVSHKLLPKSIHLPQIPWAQIRAQLKKDLAAVQAHVAEHPEAAAQAQEYVNRAEQAVQSAEQLESTLGAVGDALAQGDVGKAGELINEDLVEQVEDAIGAVEQAGQLHTALIDGGIIPPETNPDGTPKEEGKQWWEVLLDVLFTALRIFMFIMQILGSGQPSEGPGTGPDSGFGPGTGPGEVPLAQAGAAAAGDLASSQGNAHVIGDAAGGEHLVASTKGRNGLPAILLGLHRSLDNPVELPVNLTDGNGQLHRLVDAFKTGKAAVKSVVEHGDDSVTLQVAAGNETYQIKWNGKVPTIEGGRG